MLKLTATLAVMAIACEPSWAGTWVKGNLHCHTDASDGDAPLQVVADWYKSNGYGFVFVTDHNKVTDVSGYSLYDGFLLLRGEEISASFGKPVHVCALGLKATVAPATGADMVDTIRRNVELARDSDTIALVNHPNWHYSFDHRELACVEGPFLMEVYNGSSGCNNSGDESHISVEQIWDVLLSRGKLIYCVASDDAHCYTRFEAGRDNPGSGYVVARVNDLTPSEVMRALREGDFYASTGVELAHYYADAKGIRLTVKPADGNTYRIRFVGMHGQILREVDGTEAGYQFTGGTCDTYVRVKVISSDGTVAWTQPVRR